MKLFEKNISNTGRIIRAVLAVALFAGAVLTIKLCVVCTIALALSAAFVLFEALRGWCALRACGIKTRV